MIFKIIETLILNANTANTKQLSGPEKSSGLSRNRPRPLGPVHTNPDIFKSATFSFRIQYFNDHTYPYSNQIFPSTRIQDVSGFTLVVRTPLGILATEHALYSARNFNLALLTRPSTGKRKNLGTRLPS